MAHILCCAALLLAGLTAAACGGGGGATVTPPPTGMYSNASLNGTYAFSMEGEDGNGDPIIRIGSFQADGNGNIEAGIEDVNDAGTVESYVFTPAPTSTYTVSGNGKGTVTLVHPDPVVAGENDVFTFSIALTSTSGGLMIESDGSSTMSGNFTLQNISSNFAPSYAFDTSGVDLNLGTSESIIGSFTTNGTSGITGGTLDDNDAGPSAGPSPISPGTITPDPTYFSQFGRGTFTINATVDAQILNLSFEFYVVDNSHMIFVEEDGSKATLGNAVAQSAVPTSVGQLTGNYVFAVGGAVFNVGVFGPLTRAGIVAPNGNGTLASAIVDQNFTNGPSVLPGSGSSITASAYTIDGSGDGRGTVTFTDSSSGYQFIYVFYLATATQGFIQDDSSNTTADGSLTAQTASLSSSSIAGNYAFNWSGTSSAAQDNEEDFLGVFTIPSGGGSITNGSVDFVQFGVKNPHVDQGLTGTFTLSGTGTGGGTAGNTLQLTASNAITSTANFRVYAISNSNFVIVCTDNNRVVIGPMQLQQ
jgi:hypothetical protein